MVPIFLLMGKQGLGKENGHPLSHATGPTLHTRHLMEPHCSSIIPQVPIYYHQREKRNGSFVCYLYSPPYLVVDDARNSTSRLFNDTHLHIFDLITLSF